MTSQRAFFSFYLAFIVLMILNTGHPDAQAQSTGQNAILALAATAEKSGPTITSGITWRIFDPRPNPDGSYKLVASSDDAMAQFPLMAGRYIIHAAYGHAGFAERITVNEGFNTHAVIMNAGGLKLLATTGGSVNLSGPDVTFDILMENPETEEQKTVIENISAGQTVRVTAGTYTIVSRYGKVNAIRRADIEVKPGKLTSARIVHKAARITLKLVAHAGGEALPNTAWQLLTPSGDLVIEAVSAFPTFILAEGEYAVIAKNENSVYNRNFSVESGVDRDVEVAVNVVAQ